MTRATRSISEGIISCVLLLLVLVGLSALATGSYAADTEAFVITHGPYLQHLDTTAVTIVWTTNRNSTGLVELAPDDGKSFYAEERPQFYDSPYGLKNISTLHSVRIENLKPGTKYLYRIYSTEVLDHQAFSIRYGNTAATDVYSKAPLAFKTPNPSASDAEFAMISDIHTHTDVMRSLLKQVPWKSTDLVLFNGDMANQLEGEPEMFASFMDTAVDIFASETPVFYVRGNHETRGVFASRFADYFPSPDGRLYYMLRRGPVCFVALDSGEDKPDSDIEYHGVTDFDRYRTEEALWLKDALQSEMFRTATYRVAVIHIPPTADTWHGTNEVAEKFLPLLNAAGTDVMLCGHMHEYLRVQPEKSVRDFPVIINSDDTLLLGHTEKDGLHITVQGVDGKVVDQCVIKGHR